MSQWQVVRIAWVKGEKEPELGYYSPLCFKFLNRMTDKPLFSQRLEPEWLEGTDWIRLLKGASC